MTTEVRIATAISGPIPDVPILARMAVALAKMALATAHGIHIT
jgi:hypothetical protein